jgi:hypothetical protein
MPRPRAEHTRNVFALTRTITERGRFDRALPRILVLSDHPLALNHDLRPRPYALMDDSIAASRALVATARDSLLMFLRIELGIANTMLDGAAISEDEASRRRRRDRAGEACGEVVRYLGFDSARTGLSTADREELTAGLQAVQARLAEPGADRRAPLNVLVSDTWQRASAPGSCAAPLPTLADAREPRGSSGRPVDWDPCRDDRSSRVARPRAS